MPCKTLLYRPNIETRQAQLYVYADEGLHYFFGTNPQTPVTNGTLDKSRYANESASIKLNGVDQDIRYLGLALDTYLHQFDSCTHRLNWVRFEDNTSRNHGIYTVVRDSDNYETMWVEYDVGVKFDLRYKLVIGGSVIHDLTLNLGHSAFSTNKWFVFDVVATNEGGSTNKRIRISEGGVNSVLSSANASTGFNSAGGEGIYWGRAIDFDTGNTYWLKGWYDSFVSHKGGFISELTFISGGNNLWNTAPAFKQVWDNYHIAETNSYPSGNFVAPVVTTTNKFAGQELSNIPCFAEQKNILYITGLDKTNRKLKLVKPIRTFLNHSVVGGSLAPGTYYYVYAFWDQRTGMVSDLSPEYSVTLGASGGIQLFNWQRPPYNETHATGYWADKIALFRSTTSGGPYKLVSTPNAFASSQIDNNTDPIIGPPITGLYGQLPLFISIHEQIGSDPLLIISNSAGPPNNFLAGAEYTFAFSIYDPIFDTESALSDDVTYTVPVNSVRLNISPSSAHPEYAGNVLQYGGKHFIFRVYLKENGIYKFIGEEDFIAAPFLWEDPTAVKAPFIFIRPITPPQVQFVEHHNGRNWYANSVENSNRIWFSDVNDLERIISTSFLDIGSSSDPITGIKSFLGFLVVFKENSVWLVTGNTQDSISQIDIAGNAGCINHRTIAEADNLLFFANGQGVYIFDGARIKYLSLGINDLFTTINPFFRGMMAGVVDAFYGTYMLSVRIDKRNVSPGWVPPNQIVDYSVPNDTILVFDYRTYLKDGIESFTKWSVPVSTFASGYFDGDYFIYYAKSSLLGPTPDLMLNNIQLGKFVHNNQDRGFFNNDLKIKWFWQTVPITSKGDRTRFEDLKVFFGTDALTENQNIELGFTYKGSLTTRSLVLRPSDNSAQIKVRLRSDYLAAYFSGDTSERIYIFGYNLRKRSVDMR